MQKHHLLALASLLAVSTAWAEDRPAPPAPPSFSSLDSNGDGEISSSEAANDPMLSHMFSRIDTDGSGTLSEAEFKAALSHGPGDRHGPPSFASLDTDGDGMISTSEAASDPMLSQMFDKLDANGDGVISEDEYRAPPPPRR
ncbi:EF-hand domain-containing protein [Gallaecimonas pentaromativorans]|uniref:EF-hand domain-containing protein n=1 Tax=Gallaecimonas pentaromativorans TaxID=584787 RepID=UPI002EC8CD84|nr:EF-hand domain-containing protein [Pseudomonadota bacterium]